LLELGPALEAKISLEAHASRQEGEKADAHADRRSAQGGNAELGAARVDLAADVEDEIVEAVHEHVDAIEKRVDVAVVDAVIEGPDRHFRVDRAGHLLQHLGLGTPDGVDVGADLPVEIHDVEAVEIRDAECADAETRQGQEMDAPDASHARDRHALEAQGLLLPFGQPADVPVEREIV
jgi:hypothetical protein